ncbi:DNA primase [Galactobacter caseinivorans]|uniref:DNA primase n=1 Tax=Galactobacter caseinivorans TaxID=2676123 RepID=UPI0011C49DA4|nr:DNA primase [Galactobacter caseinivorans]
MTSLDRWVRADGKRPVTVAGRAASSTNRRTWSSHAAVCESTAGDGMGVMLGGGLGCYDLDGCLIDGHLTDEARRIIDTITAPILFTEVSVSGRGLHIFTAEPESKAAQGAWGGHYSFGRFIRTTGIRFTG